MNKVLSSILIAFIFFFLGYTAAFILPVSFFDTEDTDIEVVEEEMSLEDLAAETIQALSDNDLEALGKLADAEGVTFAPYAYFDNSSLTLQLDQIDTNKVYHWGLYDGPGEPIDLTYADYQAEFIYDKDYQNVSDEVVYNQLVQRGSVVPNIEDEFPNADFVEYHQAGEDPEFGGLDWTSLILVFENNKLRAIGHSQWTT